MLAEPEAAGLPATIVLALAVSSDDHSDAEQVASLREAIKGAPADFRQKLLWAHEELVNTHFPASAQDPHSRLYGFYQHNVFQANVEMDGDWLVSDLDRHTRTDSQRTTALGLLTHLTMPDRLAFLESLQPSVADNEQLSQELAQVVSYIRNPPAEEDWQLKNRKHEAARQTKYDKDYSTWEAMWTEIQDDPAVLNSDARFKYFTLNLWRAMRRQSNSRATSGWNRGFLERTFSSSIADIVREALMRRWRGIAPTTRREREPDQRNNYDDYWTLGIAGIYAESEQKGWARKLSREEAELAVRYALADHQIPPWLQDLAEVHPNEVRSLIGKELEFELGEPGGPLQHSMLLQSLEHTDIPLAGTFSAFRIAMRGAGSPPSRTISQYSSAAWPST